MNELVSELLEGLEENKKRYWPLRHAYKEFDDDLGYLSHRLKLMVEGGKSFYPFDEVIHTCGRYVIYLRSTTNYCDEMGLSYISDVRTCSYEVSDDFMCFVMNDGCRTYGYDVRHNIAEFEYNYLELFFNNFYGIADSSNRDFTSLVNKLNISNVFKRY